MRPPSVPDPRSSTERDRPILILSAFAPELAPLRLALRRAALSPPAVVCVAAGIGAVDAAVGATSAIHLIRPRFVIFTGTAGSYGAAPPVGAVVLARRLFLVSTAVARADGFLPAAMELAARADARLVRALRAAAPPGGAAMADVATPLAITSARALAARLAKTTGAAVENLEAFAVARAAALADVPFAAVLGIANRVGPTAHAEWLHNQAGATAAASRVLAAFLTTTLRGPSRSRPDRP